MISRMRKNSKKKRTWKMTKKSTSKMMNHITVRKRRRERERTLGEENSST